MLSISATMFDKVINNLFIHEAPFEVTKIEDFAHFLRFTVNGIEGLAGNTAAKLSDDLLGLGKVSDFFPMLCAHQVLRVGNFGCIFGICRHGAII